MTVLCSCFFCSFRAGFGVWNLVIDCYYVLISGISITLLSDHFSILLLLMECEILLKLLVQKAALSLFPDPEVLDVN
jgi:hypothetical protein